MQTRRNLARFSLVLAAWLLALLPGALLAQRGSRIALVTGSGHSVGTTFRDCLDVCPEMVVIPAGRFMMGSPDDDKGRGEGESLLHEVRIAYSFAVGKYPVTRGEWRQFVKATGHREDPPGCIGAHYWENPGYSQDDRHPVVCITWDDATSYATWLAAKTGHQYRLLSEAEYEYVNRAGSMSRYFWGDSEGDLCRYANGGDTSFCKSEYAHTSPVGHFQPNRFGLYDTTGNVREWVQDRYHAYGRAPGDGRPWEDGREGRVLRGGSWYYSDDASAFRAAKRYLRAHGADNDIGFRVARDDR
jgi:formylglycine-generating enzyme required for sulfatase activity